MKNERSIKKIEEFLEDLTFSKTLFGANQSDVYACLKEVSGMYEDVIKGLEEDHAEEIAELKKEIVEKDALLTQAQQAKASAAAMPDATHALNRQDEIIGNLRAQLDMTRGNNNEYKLKLEQLASVVEKQQREKADIYERAQREGRTIIIDAKQKAERIINEAKDLARSERQMAQDALIEVARVRESIQGNLRLIASDLTSMSSDVEQLRHKVSALPDKDEQSEMKVPMLNDILSKR